MERRIKDRHTIVVPTPAHCLLFTFIPLGRSLHSLNDRKAEKRRTTLTTTSGLSINYYLLSLSFEENICRPNPSNLCTYKHEKILNKQQQQKEQQHQYLPITRYGENRQEKMIVLDCVIIFHYATKNEE